LHFSGDLATEKAPGAFGWDYTPAIVPASMVPSYAGASPYLIFTKYNNYAIGDGDGVNKIALLDPNTTQIDPHPSANGLVEMREVLTVSGPTPDDDHFSATYPNAKREWCINAAAVRQHKSRASSAQRRRGELQHVVARYRQPYDHGYLFFRFALLVEQRQHHCFGARKSHHFHRSHLVSQPGRIQAIGHVHSHGLGSHRWRRNSDRYGHLHGRRFDFGVRHYG
jgi:hypothetical protein